MTIRKLFLFLVYLSLVLTHFNEKLSYLLVFLFYYISKAISTNLNNVLHSFISFLSNTVFIFNFQNTLIRVNGKPCHLLLLLHSRPSFLDFQYELTYRLSMLWFYFSIDWLDFLIKVKQWHLYTYLWFYRFFYYLVYLGYRRCFRSFIFILY